MKINVLGFKVSDKSEWVEIHGTYAKYGVNGNAVKEVAVTKDRIIGIENLALGSVADVCYEPTGYGNKFRIEHITLTKGGK